MDKRYIYLGVGLAAIALAGCDGKLKIEDTVPAAGWGGGASGGGASGAVSADEWMLCGPNLPVSTCAYPLDATSPHQDWTARTALSGIPWGENPEGCPPSPPVMGAPCEAQPGTECWFEVPVSMGFVYPRYRCAPVSDAGLRWHQTGHFTDALPTYASAASCPLEPPQAGDSCRDALGARCVYRSGASCECDMDYYRWDCLPPRIPEPPLAPSGIDPTTRVAALTPEQRTAWCGWHSRPASPSALWTNESGFACNLGDGVFSVRSVMGLAARYFPVLPPEFCVANLELSTCEGTLGQLEDCIRSIHTAYPQPLGCAPYLNQPGCDGTIVNRDGPGFPHYPWSCMLRVVAPSDTAAGGAPGDDETAYLGSP